MDKWDKEKVVQKTNYLSRGHLPGPCQTSCLRSLHLQMVTWESCQSCFSNNCSFKRCLFQLRRWPPAIGPFSSIKRRQVLLSMLFIDARITLRSALVISCVFRVFSSICWFCQHQRQDQHQHPDYPQHQHQHQHHYQHHNQAKPQRRIWLGRLSNGTREHRGGCHPLRVTSFLMIVGYKNNVLLVMNE